MKLFKIFLALSLLAVPASVRADIVAPTEKPKIEAVFVLDTTGSMSGLIQAAKEKIWSIANTMAQAKPAPEIRVGLVGYRDRGDAYVTKLTPQTADLDAMYRALMDFSADGGGDEPESVNQALHEAVNKFEWSSDKNTYKVIFLVGDAPPQMSYQDDVKYPATLEAARAKGIIVNAVQCGSSGSTTPVWQEIAKLGSGSFFQVAQGGDAFVKTTPYDEELSRLSSKLEGTKLYWGSADERARGKKRDEVAQEIAAAAPASAKAGRAVFNASEAGSKNFGGENELLTDLADGKVALDKIAPKDLPEPLQALSPEERRTEVKAKTEERKQIEGEINELAKKRQSYLETEAKKTGKDKDSLDARIFTAVKEQAVSKGLSYSGGPSY